MVGRVEVQMVGTYVFSAKGLAVGYREGLAVLGFLVILTVGRTVAGAFLESFTGDPAKYLAATGAVGPAMGPVIGVAVCAGVCLTGVLSFSLFLSLFLSLCALDGAGVTSLCPCLSDLDGFMVTGCFDGLAVLGLLVFLATGADDDRACDAGAFLESFTGDPAKYLAATGAVGPAMGPVIGVAVCAGVCLTGRLSGAPR